MDPNRVNHFRLLFTLCVYCVQPRSQGSPIRPTERERAGRKEPWERGCIAFWSSVSSYSFYLKLACKMKHTG